MLGLSLGMSGVYSLVSIIAKLTAEGSLRSQTSTLNASQSVREYLDLTYQLLGIVNTLVPVALVIWLLAGDTPRWRAFNLLMGNDVAPRKDFIIEGAAGLDRERIDA